MLRFYNIEVKGYFSYMKIHPKEIVDFPEDFPPISAATKEGLLAIGGDLGTERLINAYRRGIFPWYDEGQPVLWWSPDPRCVLFPGNYRRSRRLLKAVKKSQFRFTLDYAFAEVIDACAMPRMNQSGTWITTEMKTAYCDLHRIGIAHSVETWQDNQLVGGLYGIAIGGVFYGESMFSRISNASKAALSYLIQHLNRWNFRIIDCQVTSAHLLTLGAQEITRASFLKELEFALRLPGKPGNWQT